MDISWSSFLSFYVPIVLVYYIVAYVIYTKKVGGKSIDAKNDSKQTSNISYNGEVKSQSNANESLSKIGINIEQKSAYKSFETKAMEYQLETVPQEGHINTSDIQSTTLELSEDLTEETINIDEISLSKENNKEDELNNLMDEYNNVSILDAKQEDNDTDQENDFQELANSINLIEQDDFELVDDWEEELIFGAKELIGEDIDAFLDKAKKGEKPLLEEEEI